MGPGYFPRLLSGILMAFGLYVALRGLRTGEKVEGIWGWRPLAIITVAFWVFGWAIDHIGGITAFAGHEFNLLEVVILTIVLILFACGVFIYALGLPYPLFWWS